MGMQDGAKLALFVNGAPLTRATNIEFTNENGVVRIETLEGLAGFADGSGMSRITFEHPIMIEGHEVDVHGMVARKEYVEMQVWMGALTYAGKGKMESASSSHGVGNPATSNAQWTGELKSPE